MDFYWGGPERRITGLTLRIIGVNVFALLILAVGVLYLGEYRNRLIETKLETFRQETQLVAAALAESAFADDATLQELKRVTERLTLATSKRIQVYNAEGRLIIDTGSLLEGHNASRNQALRSLEILKNMADFILRLLPDRQILPSYPENLSKNAYTHENASDAMEGQISISAWHNKDNKIFLSAAAPVLVGKEIAGAILMTREGRDIEEDLNQVWLDVLRIFLITLVITTLLSIYLSNVIARPLRKLARAAESVRAGKSKDSEIPDLSHRKDEIGELSIVLRDMMDALWERMDSIEHFAADVAHELKNPLTSLRSAIETASVVTKKEDRDKLFAIIKHDVERLERLIGDISSASRIEAELSREAFNRFNLYETLRQLIDIYKAPLDRKRDKHRDSSAHFRGVKIHLEESKNIYVMGLQNRLVQVFENLISNAVSFSPENGIVRICLKPVKNKVQVTVEDDGPGIPDNKLETVFERFYSERPHYEDYGQHSGLGLSICRQIIEAHHGIIFAENIRNERSEVKGARFTVILDMVP